MAAISGNSAAVVIVVVVVRTRPRAIPLAMITMRKLTHGFPFLSYMSMGLPSGRRSSAILFFCTCQHTVVDMAELREN